MQAALRLGWSAVYVRRSADGVALIDAGPDYAGAWESLIEQLAQLGVRAQDVRQVLITHAHIDHAGLALRWSRLGAQVWIGAADARALEVGEEGVAAVRAAGRALLIEQGVPEQLFVRSKELSPPERAEGLQRGHYDHAAHWPGPLCWPPAQPHGILEEGDTIAGLRVLSCPGHTPGSTVFFDEAGGLLYTGDHLLPGVTPPPGLIFCEGLRQPGLPLWLASLQRLRDLPVASVLPGHGEPFEDLRAAVDRNLAHVEQQARRLLRLLQRGPRTPYDLLLLLYPHLPAGLLWFKLAELISLLDLLIERDAARLVERGIYAAARPRSPRHFC